MNEIKVEDAVGKVLLHDITRIVKGEFKGVGFKKGHIIQKEDVEKLKDLGKFYIYAGEVEEGSVHENDAALFLAQNIAGKNISLSPVKEGKIELISTLDGYLKIDIDRLNAINDLENIIVATRLEGFGIKKGDKLAGTRIIPLFIQKEQLKKVSQITNGKPIIEVLPFKAKKYAIITVGNEVYHKRIKDTFTPTVEEKLKAYNCTLCFHKTVSDDVDMISQALSEAIENKDVEMIFCTGGMSVDPDDRTPLAIKKTGAEIVSYGVPSLPGSMFMLSFLPDGRPIAGLPGCVMFSKTTIFDAVLPKLIAGIRLDKKFFNSLGYGGFCSSCPVCHFPNCWYLKGY